MLKKITNYARANVKLPSTGLFLFIHSQERCKINIQNLSFIIHAGYEGSDLEVSVRRITHSWIRKKI